MGITDMPEFRTVDDIQLGDIAFWDRPLDERHNAFAALRAQMPFSFHEERTVIEGTEAGPGFWSAVRYEDVRAINRQAQAFSSAEGITLGETAPETLEFFGSMIVLDDPRHAKMRLLVQKGFTPKMVAQVDQNVRVRAKRLVEAAKIMGISTANLVDFLQTDPKLWQCVNQLRARFGQKTLR